MQILVTALGIGGGDMANTYLICDLDDGTKLACPCRANIGHIEKITACNNKGINIEFLPTKSVKSANWLCDVKSMRWSYYKCSRCGYSKGEGGFNFCPMCGIRMKGVTNDDSKG